MSTVCDGGKETPMPVSDDTGASVAAQLTSAWMQCIHVNELPNSEAELLDVYRRFKDDLQQDRLAVDSAPTPIRNED